MLMPHEGIRTMLARQEANSDELRTQSRFEVWNADMDLRALIDSLVRGKPEGSCK